MVTKSLLFGRKRTRELKGEQDNIARAKQDELLALKLQEISQDSTAAGHLQELPLALVRPDPNQPRKSFKNIASLADSIKAKGIIQPIIVRGKNEEGYYTIIAGERRYQAALEAELKTVPCIIREENDVNVVILQLLENDQRENVSPLEESDALNKLVHDMKVNKSKVAKELGHDAAWISIRLGLKEASEEVKSLVDEGLIEDVRTLHELRMFEAESPKKAKELMRKIRLNQVSGSYRQVISQLRQRTQGAKKAKVSPRKVKKMECVGNRLLLDIGTRHPVEYTLTPEVLLQFMASVSYDE